MTENTDEYYMRRAIEWSRRGLENGNLSPVGCVIVRDGVILGEGHNRIVLDMDVTAHGEMVAIRNAVKAAGRVDALIGATIYTNTQPCPMCYSACKWAGITRIVYAISIEETFRVGGALGFVDTEIWEDVQRAPERRSIPQSCLLSEEALPVMHEWVELCATVPQDQLPYQT